MLSNATRPLFRLIAALGVSLLLVSACSSTSSDSPGSEVVPPIEITKASDVTVDVGSVLVISTEGVTRISTDNPEVLKISQPTTQGDAKLNAGADVISPGAAVIDVYGADDAKLYDVNVTATEGGAS